jgi:hypothetical protein
MNEWLHHLVRNLNPLLSTVNLLKIKVKATKLLLIVILVQQGTLGFQIEFSHESHKLKISTDTCHAMNIKRQIKSANTTLEWSTLGKIFSTVTSSLIAWYINGIHWNSIPFHRLKWNWVTQLYLVWNWFWEPGENYSSLVAFTLGELTMHVNCNHDIKNAIIFISSSKKLQPDTMI